MLSFQTSVQKRRQLWPKYPGKRKEDRNNSPGRVPRSRVARCPRKWELSRSGGLAFTYWPGFVEANGGNPRRSPFWPPSLAFLVSGFLQHSMRLHYWVLSGSKQCTSAHGRGSQCLYMQQTSHNLWSSAQPGLHCLGFRNNHTSGLLESAPAPCCGLQHSAVSLAVVWKGARPLPCTTCQNIWALGMEDTSSQTQGRLQQAAVCG